MGLVQTGYAVVMLLPEDRMLLEDVFDGIQLAPETVSDVMDLLSERAESVHTAVPPAVAESWFGSSESGGHRLATNTTMAHDAIVKEMNALVAGLRGYRENIKLWADDLQQVDHDSTALMRNLELSADCTTAPTFGSAQCTLPVDSEDGA